MRGEAGARVDGSALEVAVELELQGARRGGGGDGDKESGAESDEGREAGRAQTHAG